MKQAINEVKRMQELAGIQVNEDGIDTDREQIEAWYTKSNPWIDQLSQEEEQKGIQAHYEEWMASKEHYDDIEDYFEDVENSKDWYQKSKKTYRETH